MHLIVQPLLSTREYIVQGISFFSSGCLCVLVASSLGHLYLLKRQPSPLNAAKKGATSSKPLNTLVLESHLKNVGVLQLVKESSNLNGITRFLAVKSDNVFVTIEVNSDGLQGRVSITANENKLQGIGVANGLACFEDGRVYVW